MMGDSGHDWQTRRRGDGNSGRVGTDGDGHSDRQGGRRWWRWGMKLSGR